MLGASARLRALGLGEELEAFGAWPGALWTKHAAGGRLRPAGPPLKRAVVDTYHLPF